MPIRMRALVTVLCAVVLGALLPAATAHAESHAVQGGRLDWGIKSSFQSYVTGPIAKGSWSLTGGAATVGGSAFRFHSASGSYDPGTGAFRAAFLGGVHFTGHRTKSGEHQLDLTLSRPTVSISGSTGTLHLDVVSRAKGTGAVTTSRQVPFASLSLRAIDMRGGGTSVVLRDVPATLTAQGARSFAGYYTAGTPLDPVSLSADIRQAARQPSDAPTSKAPEPTKNRSATDGRITDGAVDWGVRRTFREYVTGDIAQGRWTLTSGALDGGALYRFPGGTGTFRDGDLTASFDGAVRFTGKHGLDLTLDGIRVTIGDGRGTLLADVRTPDHSARGIPLVTFTAQRLRPEDGLVMVKEAPTQLTAEGARALGGMYPKGTAMDPVSIAVALTEDAELPALPDLGSDPAPSTTPPASPASSPEPVANASRDDGGLPVLPLTLAAGSLAALAAVAAYLVRRRRRALPTSDAPSQDN